MAAPIKTEKQIKRSKIIDKISYLIISIILVGSIFFGGTVLFQKKYFHTTWVNGQSMYPTLNANAVNRNGKLKGFNGGSASNGDKNLDLVIYDGHDRIMNRIDRFDIVIVVSPYDNTTNFIKRLCVLPGETFYFGVGEDNGQLFVKDGEQYNKVAQPIDDSIIRSGSYSKYTVPTTLANDEYFVCGDNRGHSSDSREFGPIKREKLLGIVVALVGTCDATSSGNGVVTYTNINYKWPRFFK